MIARQTAGFRCNGHNLRRVFWVLALIVPVSIVASQNLPKPRRAGPAATSPRPAREAGAHGGYVGSEACATCHWGIYSQFKKTDMARSISKITPSFLQGLGLPATYYDSRFKRHYDVYARSGDLYQSQFELDAAGKEIFRDTHRLQWIIGSGANVSGAIVKRGNYLFEAPLAFYTKPKAWGLEPGYESTDLGFNRPMLAACIACHSGRSMPIPGTNGAYDNPVFVEMSIGCERCHGPGAAHIQAMKSGKGLNGKDLHIVNPAHLTPYLANNICMSCHEIGDERILKPGKAFQDFLPGTPLDNTFSVLMVPPTRTSPPQGDHLQQYYSMTLSKCYRASSGRLRCITCHDPHIEPSAQEAPAYFNSRCLTCHNDQSCSLPLKVRQQKSPPDDCIACHMPKRSVLVIAHSSLTNHRILARPDEPFPDITFEQTTPSLPDLIHLNPAPGKEGVRPPLLTLLQAYGQLAAYRTEYVAHYLKVLDELSRTEPENELVQAALGRRDLLAGKFQEASDHLLHALRIGPPQATVYGDLAEAEYRLGKREEALSLLRKGIGQDPFNPLLQRALVHLLIDLKQDSIAQAALEHYLEIFPQDSSMRQLLLGSKRDAPQN